MQEENNRIYLLSKEKVSKALLKLGIPTMIGMMTSALYNLVDAYFVARLGTSQMGAVVTNKCYVEYHKSVCSSFW